MPRARSTPAPEQGPRSASSSISSALTRGPLLSATHGTTVARPLSKGTNFLHVRSYLEHHAPPNAWRALVDSFEPEQRLLLDSIVPIGWYPVELDLALLHRVDRLYGRGDLALMHQMGRHAAECDLSGIQRMFLRIANPALILEKARDYWSRFHNTGYWTVQRLHPRAAVGTLRGWAVVDPAACLHLGAYIVRMFELIGTRRVRFEHDFCRCRGHEDCVFSGEWAE